MTDNKPTLRRFEVLDPQRRFISELRLTAGVYRTFAAIGLHMIPVVDTDDEITQWLGADTTPVAGLDAALAAKDAEIERLTRELAEVRASHEAWAIEAMGLEAQRDAATLALAEAHIRNGHLREENRRRPHTVCISGSMQYETEMHEVTCRESVKGHIVVMPNCNMKKPHPLWDTEEKAERVKTALDQLHFGKIDLADEVIVVSDQTGYYGQSTAEEIAYAKQRGKRVRHERVQLKTEAEPETCGDCIEGRCHWGSFEPQPGEECGCERHDASVKARGLDDTTGGA